MFGISIIIRFHQRPSGTKERDSGQAVCELLLLLLRQETKHWARLEPGASEFQ